MAKSLLNTEQILVKIMLDSGSQEDFSQDCRTVGDVTQVLGVGRVSWKARVRHNEIIAVELRSNMLSAKVAFNSQGQFNMVEVIRGIAPPIMIAFDEQGKLVASQDGVPIDRINAYEAFSACYQLFDHAAVHRKLAEAVMTEANRGL